MAQFNPRRGRKPGGYFATMLGFIGDLLKPCWQVINRNHPARQSLKQKSHGEILRDWVKILAITRLWPSFQPWALLRFFQPWPPWAGLRSRRPFRLRDVCRVFQCGAFPRRAL